MLHCYCAGICLYVGSGMRLNAQFLPRSDLKRFRCCEVRESPVCGTQVADFFGDSNGS
jgi:hypothetical protein